MNFLRSRNGKSKSNASRKPRNESNNTSTSSRRSSIESDSSASDNSDNTEESTSSRFVTAQTRIMPRVVTDSSKPNISKVDPKADNRKADTPKKHNLFSRTVSRAKPVSPLAPATAPKADSAASRVPNVYDGDKTNLLEIWKRETASTVSKNRGKNKPEILQIDNLLNQYQKLGRPRLGYTQEHIDKLDEINKKINDLLKNPGSRKAAAEELQRFIQAELQKVNSQPEDITKIDINQIINWGSDQVPNVMTGGVRDTLNGQKIGRAHV